MGGRTRFWASVVAAATAATVAGTVPAGADTFGDARTLAPFPAAPGFPEGIAVRDGRVYAAGAATFGTTGGPPSTVVAYDRATGVVVARYDTVGENRLAEHANSSIAFDGAGRLLVLNTQLGTYRLDPATGSQTSYSAPFPDLQPCVPLLVPPPCSPTLLAGPPIPNDLAFAPDGNLYVTDSLQATIWRVPPGGGTPRIWFQDRRLASPYIGVNGLRVDPSGTRVLFTVSTDLLGAASLYSLPLVAQPQPWMLRLEHRFEPGELPDGIAFGDGGDVYVAMAAPTRPGILVLGPDRTVRARLHNPPLSLIDPYDGPANMAFDGAGRLVATNHAPVTGLVLRRFSIVDVFVDDAGAPLLAP